MIRRCFILLLAPVLTKAADSAGESQEVWLTVNAGAAVAPAATQVTHNTVFYKLSANVTFDQKLEMLSVKGTYRTSQAIDPTSLLSYQLLDEHGQTLMQEGARAKWARTADGELVSDFDLRFPILWKDPERRTLRVSFNAVKEGQYWYRTAHPEVRFPLVELRDIPQRDHFAPLLTFIPHFLPAGVRCRLPVIWREAPHNATPGGFRGALDVREPAKKTRIEEQRIPRESAWRLGQTVMVWQWLDPIRQGDVEIRPGLVWDGARWYDANDWFEWRRVKIVSPLEYGIVIIGIIFASLMAWRLAGRWPWRTGTIASRGVIIAFGSWIVLSAIVTGFWVVAVPIVATGWVVRRKWGLPGGRIYLVTWLFMAFTEVYWGWLVSEDVVQDRSTLFSLAVWVFALSPLLFIRQRWLRRTLGFGVMAVWLVAMAAMMCYRQFFQDYPSIENLIYAGQLEHLGGSISALLVPKQWVPGIVLCAMIGQTVFARESGTNDVRGNSPRPTRNATDASASSAH